MYIRNRKEVPSALPAFSFFSQKLFREHRCQTERQSPRWTERWSSAVGITLNSSSEQVAYAPYAIEYEQRCYISSQSQRAELAG
ncbi:hypothetical protein EVAR_89520_1 [Eumeta japonica]|uniref:Uncharacterized protein n=1 Tax=Eumeta variegata TaxID=151549 RepID=A0A4C1Y745_EUMVA|nr:hypothetical protein EVAR_89520_1 [Eumeta japonica]